MASLTRSASLTDLIGSKNETNESDYGSYYGSPQKRGRTKLKPVNFYGNSVGKNWTWLTNSKSFHEKSIQAPPLYSQVENDEDRKTQQPQTTKATERPKQKIVRVRYLEHLERLLPQFCKQLSHPTYQEAARAMSLLLNSPPPIVVSEGMKHQHHAADESPGSPEKQSRQTLLRKLKERDKSKTSVKNEMNRILSSPFRSRIPRRKLQDGFNNKNNKNNNDAVAVNNRRWSSLSSGGSLLSQSSTSSTRSGSQDKKNNVQIKSSAGTIAGKLEEAAWREFVGPLLLLAGAEAIYADLEHVHPSPTIIQWSGLYQRVLSELVSLLPQEEQTSLLSPSRRKPTAEASNETGPHEEHAPPLSPNMPPHISPKQSSTPISPSFSDENATITTEGIAPTTPTTTNKTLSSLPQDSANIKYKRLRSLCIWLDYKCQWLPFHESLYVTWSPDNLIFVRAFAEALPSLQTASSEGNECSLPLMKALQQEIHATLALMEMAFWLERGRFLETIVSARKVKDYLMTLNRNETALMLWMRITFQDYLSIMPLVFDRIHTFATPLYGFDQQILLDSTQNERTFLNDNKAVADLEVLVVDFLRRHEKAGGTPMAVTIVIDTDGLEEDDAENQAPSDKKAMQTVGSSASQPHNKHFHHVELGFAIHHTPKQQLESKKPPKPTTNIPTHKNEDSSKQSASLGGKELSSTDIPGHKQWPAIFLRSSLRLSPQGRGGAASSAGLGLISGMRRNVSESIRRSGTMESSVTSLHGSGGHSSQASWSSESISPRAKYRKPSSSRSLLSHGNVFEYEADSSSRPSWPHSCWGQLRAFLDNLNTGTATANIVTDRTPASPKASPTHGVDLTSASSFEEPLAVTFHPDGVPSVSGEGATETSASIFASELPMQLWDPPVVTTSAATTAPTTFHAVHLSNFMWMIVMVKGEEESRWHRRKSRGLPDNEIRAFLNEMATKLRVSNRFVGLKTCQTARVKVKDPLAPRVRNRDLGLRDAQWQSANPEDDDQVQEEVLQLMKEAFNVNSASPMLNRAESILTTMSGGFRTPGGSRSPRDRRRVLALQRMSGPYAQTSDYRDGAALLFLGPELFRQFLESTNE